MTQLFHQLRIRSRALAQGLVLLLLASWVSTACAHCLMQADQSDAQTLAAPAMHCHEEAPPAAPKLNVHDCCAKMPAGTGGDCAQMSAIAPGEPLNMLLPNPPAPAIVSSDYLSYAYPSMPPPTVPVAQVAVIAACPLYLRYCSFLN